MNLLTAKEAAELLGMGRTAFRARCNGPHPPPFIRPGGIGRRLYERSALLAWAAETPPRPEPAGAE